MQKNRGHKKFQPKKKTQKYFLDQLKMINFWNHRSYVDHTTDSSIEIVPENNSPKTIVVGWNTFETIHLWLAPLANHTEIW